MGGAMDYRDLRRVDQLCADAPALRAATIRWWVHTNFDGFSACVVRLGRSVYIHVPTFNEWLRRHAA